MEKLCAMCYNKYDTLLMNRRKGKGMKTSYNNLWKMLIDRNMQKKDLIDKLGIAPLQLQKWERVIRFHLMYWKEYVHILIAI